jgi:hypothetical protein
MRTVRKIALTAILTVAMVVAVKTCIKFVVILEIYGGFSLFAPGYGATDRFLRDNIDILSHADGLLSELGYDFVTIRNVAFLEEDGYNMEIRKDNIYETIPIPDELLDTIEELHNKKIKNISYGRDSTDFTMWSFIDGGRGLIFSRTGEAPDIWAPIDMRELSMENWYYYASDFEKWKEQNPQLYYATPSEQIVE